MRLDELKRLSDEFGLLDHMRSGSFLSQKEGPCCVCGETTLWIYDHKPMCLSLKCLDVYKIAPNVGAESE